VKKDGNIENLKPFKKGQSGNPKGRPRKLPELRTLLADVLGEEKNGKTAAEKIIDKLRQKAEAGDIRAAELLLKYSYGQPVQRLEHSGPDGAPVETIIRFVDDSKDDEYFEHPGQI